MNYPAWVDYLAEALQQFPGFLEDAFNIKFASIICVRA